MKKVIVKSTIFAIISVIVMIGVRFVLGTDASLADVGGLGAFVTVFGTLFGIMAAFVVFEVWSQYNKTTTLIEAEAQGLERLFRLTLYFRDPKLSKAMLAAIKAYTTIVIEGNFQHLGAGERNTEASKAFRNISAVIRDITFDDDHDPVVYDHIVDHYGKLSETRTQRITQSLARMPVLLKSFLYITSAMALFTFVVMPFTSVWYGGLAVAVLGFVFAMVFQLVEDLDNPFVGTWNITPEPFKRALRHIEEDY